MMEALNSNNVAVYAIDLIPTSRGGGAAGRTLNNSLSALATDTGGNYYINFTSFEAPLRKIAEDNGGYYLLSYSSRHPAGTSGYQKVDVRAINPEFQVRARRGYLYGE
jgi:VWFA-related protein